MNGEQRQSRQVSLLRVFSLKGSIDQKLLDSIFRMGKLQKLTSDTTVLDFTGAHGET